MKTKTWMLMLGMASAITACIQNEAMNVEAAIDGCTGANIQLSDINTTDKRVILYVQKGADLSSIEVIFTLSDGATIEANEKANGDNGNCYDFSDGEARTFTVTSEDGNVTATYSLSIIQTELPTTYHFEQLLEGTENIYDTFYEEVEPTSSEDTKKILQWASGNAGYNLTGMSNDRTGFPTVQSGNGYYGACAKLETKGTGSFGAMVNMPIAAGNLFIGSFELENALANALKATKFGFSFFKVPLRLTGYYKYKAGSDYTESGVTNSSKTDRFNIYAIFYEANDNSFTLDGENALTATELVAKAQIAEEEAVEADEWTRFNIDFERMDGKTVDAEKLAAGKYKLGIVFTSSVEGDLFNGAVGSTLYIDEVELICEEAN